MNRFKSKMLSVCILILILGTAHLAMGVTSTPPINDNCSNATYIWNVNSLEFDTTYATMDGPGHYINSPNIWYIYKGRCNGCATVSLEGSTFDTKVAVYSGSDCNPTLERMIRCNDDYTDQNAKVTFPVVFDGRYLIEVGGYNISEKGVGYLTVTCDESSGSPSNDNISNAESIGIVTNKPFNTSCATFDGPGHCITSPNLWYRYTATNNSNVTVSLCGSSFDTMLAVYNGYSTNPTVSQLIECNDDACDRQSEITFAAVAGTDYLIEVGAYDTCETGEGVITITQDAVQPSTPENDNCNQAKAIGDVTNLIFNTTNATFDGPAHCMSSPNIWYCYTPAASGEVTVSLCGSDFDTMLAVYDGCSCAPTVPNMIGCNDDSCDYQSEITFNATVGHKYLIEIGGYGYQIGEGVLNITNTGGGGGGGVQANDNCQNAQQIGEVTDLPFDTTLATFDGIGVCMRSPNIWYVYSPSCNGDVTVSLCGSEFDTMLAVYQGATCPVSNSRLIACNDDACGYQSEITFPAVIGQKYLIEVGSFSTGYSTETGKGVLTVSCGGGGGTPNTSDLGDAPDSTNHAGAVMTAYPMGGALGVRANYPTVYDDGTGFGPRGPIHRNVQQVAILGESITNENEADTGPDQDVLNNINPSANTPNQDISDNGVIFPVNMPQCRWSTFNYKVKVIEEDTPFWINVWCDWNRDGDWDDTIDNACASIPEWTVQNQFVYGLEAGVHELTSPAFMAWHPKSGTKQIWMRITLSDQPWTGGSSPSSLGNGGSGPIDGYEFGETEDLYFIPDTTSTICEDFNGDGVINMDDLTTFVNDWLANCQ